MTYTTNLNQLANDFGNNGYIIGFAKKFFTLWSYSITRNEATGELVFDAYFVKNVGKENPYEGAYPFDNGLKGKELHITSGREGTGLNLTPQELKALKFSRGNDKGLVIANYCNLANLCWKYNTGFVKLSLSKARKDAELANIANRAIELGAVEIEGRLWRPEEVETATFSRNPFFGANIFTFEDANILCWKFNKKAVSEFRPESIVKQELANIRIRALELGSIEIDNVLYSPDKQKEDWFKEKMAAKVNVEANTAIEFTPTHNISVEGFITFSGLEFKFDCRYYPGTYYGPEHSFPIDRKGKAKQIKNRKIRINSYEKVTETENGCTFTYYKVIDWEFVK